MLSRLPVPGRPTNLDYSRVRAYCASLGAGGGCLDFFSLIYHFSFLSPSLWETARNRLKYCLKGPLNLKQPTSQPTVYHMTLSNDILSPSKLTLFQQENSLLTRTLSMTLHVRAKVLLLVWSYDFYDMTLSTE